MPVELREYLADCSMVTLAFMIVVLALMGGLEALFTAETLRGKILGLMTAVLVPAAGYGLLMLSKEDDAAAGDELKAMVERWERDDANYPESPAGLITDEDRADHAEAEAEYRSWQSE